MNTTLVSTAGYGVEEARSLIYDAEHLMRSMPQVEIEPTHTFADGLYARTILIPKGTILTGKVHTQNDLQIMISGDISMLTEDGYKRLKGFHIFRGKAGLKNLGRAHEDTLWVTVHAAVETDLEELEKRLFVEEPNVFDFKTGRVRPEVVAAREDFQQMLTDLGVTAELVWQQSTNELDRQDIPLLEVEIGPSPIHGCGIFATVDLEAMDYVGVARKGLHRTQLGRFVNHSGTPNCEMRVVDGDIDLYALTAIKTGEELLVDYRQSVKAAQEVGR